MRSRGLIATFFIAFSFLLLLDQAKASEYVVYVFNNVGWDKAQVNKATEGAKSIFQEECGVDVQPSAVRYLNIPDEYTALDEEEQLGLINQLKKRPEKISVFFIADSTDAFQAYSYLPATPDDNRNTIWLTRNIDERCLARTLAHEIGHLLLNEGEHRSEQSNLMHSTCVAANYTSAPTGRSLDSAQCEVLTNAQQ